jgi:hypothetical protein
VLGPDGDSTGDRRHLRRARWGGGVLTRDGRRRWGRENGPTWWHSKAAAELRWSGRGRQSARPRTHEGGREGKEKGGHGGDGAPFIGDAAGGGGWPTSGATQWRGVGEGCAAGVAVWR